MGRGGSLGLHRLTLMSRTDSCRHSLREGPQSLVGRRMRPLSQRTNRSCQQKSLVHHLGRRSVCRSPLRGSRYNVCARPNRMLPVFDILPSRIAGGPRPPHRRWIQINNKVFIVGRVRFPEIDALLQNTAVKTVSGTEGVFRVILLCMHVRPRVRATITITQHNTSSRG